MLTELFRACRVHDLQDHMSSIYIYVLSVRVFDRWVVSFNEDALHELHFDRQPDEWV